MTDLNRFQNFLDNNPPSRGDDSTPPVQDSNPQIEPDDTAQVPDEGAPDEVADDVEVDDVEESRESEPPDEDLNESSAEGEEDQHTTSIDKSPDKDEVVERRVKEVVEERMRPARQKFSEERQQFYDFWEQSRNTFAEQTNIVGSFFSSEQARIDSELQEIQGLKYSDHESYMAQMHNLQQQENRLRSNYEQASRYFQEQEKQFQSKAREFRDKELLRVLPDFSEADGNLITKALQSSGFSPDQMAKLYDPRVLLMAHEIGKLKDQISTMEKSRETENARRQKIKQELVSDAKTAKPKNASASAKSPPSKKVQHRRRYEALKKELKSGGKRGTAQQLLQMALDSATS